MGKRLKNEDFVKRAKEVHGDKYDYSKVEYKGVDEKVCIICPEHGEFWQTPLTHIYGGGCGCKECRKNLLHDRFKCSKEEFIEKARKVHGNKYDYSNVKYENSHSKIKIICPVHGEFIQEAYSHLNGRGCPKCGKECKGEKISKAKIMSQHDFLQKAKKIHGDKYDYSKSEYKGTDKKVCIICRKHGEFWQRPQVHLRGSGCPRCKESKLENEVFDFLSKNNIAFEQQKTFTWLKSKGNMFIDFYLPSKKIAIECQGDQHFVPVSFGIQEKVNKEEARKAFLLIKERDRLKKTLCEEHGIKVLYYFHSSYFKDTEIYTDKTILNNLYDLCL